MIYFLWSLILFILNIFTYRLTSSPTYKYFLNFFKTQSVEHLKNSWYVMQLNIKICDRDISHSLWLIDKRQRQKYLRKNVNFWILDTKFHHFKLFLLVYDLHQFTNYSVDLPDDKTRDIFGRVPHRKGMLNKRKNVSGFSCYLLLLFYYISIHLSLSTLV